MRKHRSYRTIPTLARHFAPLLFSPFRRTTRVTRVGGVPRPGAHRFAQRSRGGVRRSIIAGESVAAAALGSHRGNGAGGCGGDGDAGPAAVERVAASRLPGWIPTSTSNANSSDGVEGGKELGVPGFEARPGVADDRPFRTPGRPVPAALPWPACPTGPAAGGRALGRALALPLLHAARRLHGAQLETAA